MKNPAILMAAATLVLLSVSASPWASSLRQRRSPNGMENPYSDHEANVTDVPCFFLEIGSCICDGPVDCEMVDQLYPIFKNCSGTLEGIPPEEEGVTPDCTQPPEKVKDAVLCVAEIDTTFKSCYEKVTGGN